MVLMSGFGVITASLCFLFHFSFYFSMTMLFLLYLLAEGWMSPAVSMIQVSIDVRYKGVAMGVFLFATSLSGTAATLIVGVLDTDLHVKKQLGKGKVIWLNTALPCILAMVFFYISGIYYDRFRRNLAKEVEEVQEKASQFKFDSRSESVQQYGQFEFLQTDSSYAFNKIDRFTVVRSAAQSMQAQKRPMPLS